jgi:hypothetical protein
VHTLERGENCHQTRIVFPPASSVGFGDAARHGTCFISFLAASSSAGTIALASIASLMSRHGAVLLIDPEALA